MGQTWYATCNTLGSRNEATHHTELDMIDDLQAAQAVAERIASITGGTASEPYEWGMGGHRADIDCGPVGLSIYFEDGTPELGWERGDRLELPPGSRQALKGLANRMGQYDFWLYLDTGKDY